MPRHYRGRNVREKQGLRAALRYLSGDFERALRVLAGRMEALEVDWAICGGLAVAAHGYHRATMDIDVMVSDAIFETAGPIVTFKPGVPLEIHGIVIDYIPESDLGELAAMIANEDEGYPVVDLPTLLAMKLLTGRRQDIADVRKLIELGAVDDEVEGDVVTMHQEAGEKLGRLLRG